MPKITHTFSHSLGKEEAIRRIKTAVEAEKISKANFVSNTTEHWVGDHHVDFTMKIFGYGVEGTLDVTDTTVIVSLELPLVATMATGMIEDQLQQEIAGLLS